MARLLALVCGVDDTRGLFLDLWSAGFSVEQCDSEYDLVRWLARGKVPDLICVLEAAERPLDQASLMLLKRGTSAPLVLFQAQPHSSGHPWCDLVVPPGTPAREWLRSIGF